MKISKLCQDSKDRWRFNLNVGGFIIKNCRWNPQSRQILFPVRYDSQGGRHEVVFVHGTTVKRLRALLESGRTATPRDRRPCTLTIHRLRPTRNCEWDGWWTFDFTVRDFTILGCRWQPATGSIQLPVTCVGFNEKRLHNTNRRVICAYGARIVRLRKALEAHMNGEREGGTLDPAFEEVAVGSR